MIGTAPAQSLFITRQGESDLVVLSEDELTGWLETIHLLNSSKNAACLAASVQQARTGRARECNPEKQSSIECL
jgi:PHD/YefM family antitoxin component YafN of YafNO toxin-antitoxin module